MRALFQPLGLRKVWLTFLAIAVVGIIISFSVIDSRDASRVAGLVLDVVCLASAVAGIVMFLTEGLDDQRVPIERELPPNRRKPLRLAVRRGDLSLLSKAERPVANRYAAAYTTAAPRLFVFLLLIFGGIIFQACAQLVRWDGSWPSYLALAELVVLVVVLIVTSPLQSRWLTNAMRISRHAEPVDPSSRS